MSTSVVPSDAGKAVPWPHVGRRLAQLRAEISQKRWATLLGVGLSTWARYERGERLPDGDLLIRLSKNRAVDLNWLLAEPGRASALTPFADDTSQVVMVRRYSPELLSTVDRASWELEPISELAFRADWLSEKGIQPRNAFVADVRGRSMESKLFDGDLVLVDRSNTEVQSGRCYALLVEGELQIKYLNKVPGGVQVSSENPAFTPFNLPKDDQTRILGRVRASNHEWD